MVNFNTTPQSAKEYIANLTKRFGLDSTYRPIVEKKIDQVWKVWESQGVTRPSNLQDAIHRPEFLNEKYFDDILAANGLTIDNAHFFIFPWYELNAAANTLETNEHVILFDSALMALFNAITIPIIVWAYGHLSSEESNFYENFILERFEDFTRKKTLALDEKAWEKYSDDFMLIVSKNNNFTLAGTNCAIAFNSFILCHEVAHIVLEHTGSEKKLLSYGLNDKSNSKKFEINSIAASQEFEADAYGYELFLKLIGYEESAKMAKLPETYQLMPLVFFEIIDLVYIYARKRGIDYFSSNTHPNPLQRKSRLLEKIPEIPTDDNDFYGAYMAFSETIRERM